MWDSIKKWGGKVAGWQSGITPLEKLANKMRPTSKYGEVDQDGRISQFADMADNRAGASWNDYQGASKRLRRTEGLFRDRAQGRNLVSSEMLRQGLMQNRAAMQSAAAGARPGNSAMAARTAMMQGARMGAGLSGQQALAGAQEAAAAAGQLGNIQMGQMQTHGKMSLGQSGMQSGALLGLEGQKTSRYAADMGVPSPYATMAQGAAAAGAAMSDVNAKTSITPVDSVVRVKDPVERLGQGGHEYSAPVQFTGGSNDAAQIASNVRASHKAQEIKPVAKKGDEAPLGTEGNPLTAKHKQFWATGIGDGVDQGGWLTSDKEEKKKAELTGYARGLNEGTRAVQTAGMFDGRPNPILHSAVIGDPTLDQGTARQMVRARHPGVAPRGAQAAIKPPDPEVEELMAGLKGYKYNYKNPGKHGGGRHLGVMAQNLEKTKLGKAMVKDTKEGKKIDVGKLAGALGAAMSDLNERVNAMSGSGGNPVRPPAMPQAQRSYVQGSLPVSGILGGAAAADRALPGARGREMARQAQERASRYPWLQRRKDVLARGE